MDSEQASLNNRKRLEDGTHYLLFEKADQIRRETAKKRIDAGIHNFQGKKQSEFSTLRNLENIKNGTNPFAGELERQNNLKRIENGSHNFTTIRTCPHCNLTGKGHNMLRYHFDNCRHIIPLHKE